MSELDKAGVERFSAAVTRFAKAYAPFVALQLKHMEKAGETTNASAGDLLKMGVTSVVTRFAVADTAISAAEAKMIDTLLGSEGLATMVEAMGDLRGGQMFDAIAQMGGAERSDKSLAVAAQMLQVVAGAEATNEFVEAAKELAAATCALDGTSDAEHAALAEFGAALEQAASEA